MAAGVLGEHVLNLLAGYQEMKHVHVTIQHQPAEEQIVLDQILKHVLETHQLMAAGALGVPVVKLLAGLQELKYVHVLIQHQPAAGQAVVDPLL